MASNELATIQAQMAEEANAISTRIGSIAGGNRISTKGKEFTLPDGSADEGPMRVVIVDFAARNTYYPDKYNPNNIQAPDCFAVTMGDIDEMIPSTNSPDVQHENCRACPMNQFGSDGNGKACKNGRLLAVLPPSPDPDAPLMTIVASPTAIKDFDKYVTTVRTKHGVPPIGVLTDIYFDDAVDFPKLKFKIAGENGSVEDCFARREEAKQILLAEPEFTSQEETPAPKKKRRATRRR